MVVVKSSGTRGAPGKAVTVNCIVIVVVGGDAAAVSVAAASFFVVVSSPAAAAASAAVSTLVDDSSILLFCVDMMKCLRVYETKMSTLLAVCRAGGEKPALAIEIFLCVFVEERTNTGTIFETKKWGGDEM